jgi:hypothetical protein
VHHEVAGGARRLTPICLKEGTRSDSGPLLLCSEAMRFSGDSVAGLPLWLSGVVVPGAAMRFSGKSGGSCGMRRACLLGGPGSRAGTSLRTFAVGAPP